MVFIPGLIIIMRLLPKCSHYPIQVVGILSLDMFVDQPDSIVESIGHHHSSR
jgi:hypothetical protein